MSNPLGVFAAEAVGAFFLVFFGCGAILQTTAMGEAGFGLLGIALAFGIVLSIAVSATAATSGGHLNPAVSIAMAVCGKLPWGRLPIYLIAQIAGAILAAAMLRPLFPAEVIAAAGLGATIPAPGITFEAIVYAEAVMTFLLMIAIWGTAVDPRAPKIGGFGIGLAVFVDILLGGPITGASMNPARTLGPAVIGGVWDTHAAYWIGPIIGAVAGGLFYKMFLYRE